MTIKYMTLYEAINNEQIKTSQQICLRQDAETEIQKLKKELRDEKDFHKADEQQAEYLQMQVEAAKTILDTPMNIHVKLNKLAILFGETTK